MSIRLGLVLCVLTTLVACKNNPFMPLRKITLKVLPAGAGGGTVTSNEPVVAISCKIVAGAAMNNSMCSDTFEDAGGGGVFDLFALPDEASEFVQWNGCSAVSETRCTVAFQVGDGKREIVVTPTFRLRGAPSVLYGRNLVLNPGFESNTVRIGGLPTATGFWQGDSVRTGISEPIVARSGSQALQFIHTNAIGPSAEGVSSQLWQLFDLSAIAADVDAGRVTAAAAAWFFRSVGGPGSDDRFDLRIGAYRGTLAEFPASYASPAGVRLADEVTTVTVPVGAWTGAQRNFAVPPGTRYLALEIYAYENVQNDATRPEFAGHYADDLVLTLARTP